MTAAIACSSSSGAASSRCCSRAAATPTVFLDITARVLVGRRAGPARARVPPAVRDQPPLLRQLHARRRRRHRDRRVPALPRPIRTSPTSTETRPPRRSRSRSPTTTAACSRSAPTASSTSAMGDGGAGNDPRQPRAEHRRAARQDPAHRRGSPNGSRPLRVPPTTRSSATTSGARRDLRLRPAQPVALLLRPRRPASSGSATSARARARRSTSSTAAAATTAGASSRALTAPNLDPALCGDGRLHRSRSPSTARGGRCSVTGGYVYRGTRARSRPARTSSATTAAARSSCSPDGASNVLLDTGLSSRRSARTRPASSMSSGSTAPSIES